MSEFNQFQDRIDKLSLVYMEKTCDISSMTVEELRNHDTTKQTKMQRKMQTM